MDTNNYEQNKENSFSNKKTMITLFLSMVVVMLGFGVLIPVLPFIIEDMVGTDGAGQLMGILMSLYAIMQLIFSPMWGSFADKYGRKPMLIIGTLGSAIALYLFAVADQVWMLIITRALAGFLSAAFFPASMAYISDITSLKDRSRGMGLIGAAMGIGMILGPAIGGLFNSTTTPLFVVAGLSLLGMIAVYLMLPESLPVEQRSEHISLDISSQFVDMGRAINSPIGFILVLGAIISLGLTNFESVFGLYGAFKYNYDTQQIGIVLTFVGVISALSQGMLIGKATEIFGEIGLIKISLIGNAIGFVFMVLAVLEHPITIYLSVGFFVLSNAMIRPSLSSLVSKRAHVPQGMAQGLNNSFMSLGRFLGPLSAGLLFDMNIEYPYISGAVIVGIGFVLSMVYLHDVKNITTDISQQDSVLAD